MRPGYIFSDCNAVGAICDDIIITAPPYTPPPWIPDFPTFPNPGGVPYVPPPGSFPTVAPPPTPKPPPPLQEVTVEAHRNAPTSPDLSALAGLFAGGGTVPLPIPGPSRPRPRRAPPPKPKPRPRRPAPKPKPKPRIPLKPPPLPKALPLRLARLAAGVFTILDVVTALLMPGDLSDNPPGDVGPFPGYPGTVPEDRPAGSPDLYVLPSTIPYAIPRAEPPLEEVVVTGNPLTTPSPVPAPNIGPVGIPTPGVPALTFPAPGPRPAPSPKPSPLPFLNPLGFPVPELGFPNLQPKPAKKPPDNQPGLLQLPQDQPIPQPDTDPCAKCAAQKKDDQKKKKERKKRKVCYRGTYTETSDRTNKRRKEQVPCR